MKHTKYNFPSGHEEMDFEEYIGQKFEKPNRTEEIIGAVFLAGIVAVIISIFVLV